MHQPKQTSQRIKNRDGSENSAVYFLILRHLRQRLAKLRNNAFLVTPVYFRKYLFFNKIILFMAKCNRFIVLKNEPINIL